MSAFDTIEKQMAEQACRDLTEQASKGATALAERNNLDKSPSEERELAMKARYQKGIREQSIEANGRPCKFHESRFITRKEGQ